MHSALYHVYQRTVGYSDCLFFVIFYLLPSCLNGMCIFLLSGTQYIVHSQLSKLHGEMNQPASISNTISAIFHSLVYIITFCNQYFLSLNYDLSWSIFLQSNINLRWTLDKFHDFLLDSFMLYLNKYYQRSELSMLWSEWLLYHLDIWQQTTLPD